MCVQLQWRNQGRSWGIGGPCVGCVGAPRILKLGAPRIITSFHLLATALDVTVTSAPKMVYRFGTTIQYSRKNLFVQYIFLRRFKECNSPLAARTQQQEDREQQESRESRERAYKCQLPFSQPRRPRDLWPHGPWPQHSTQSRSHYTSQWWVAFIDQMHLTAEAGHKKMDRAREKEWGRREE